MHRKPIFVSLAALVLGLPAHADKIEPVYETAVVPATPEEQQLWERASNHENRLRNAGTLFHDRHMEAYIESLADRMLTGSIDHIGLNIDFVLVREPTLSAWAYPYGTIGLQTGLLVRMDNEAQFGAILAHEISHFLQRHTYREMVDGDQKSMLGKGLGILAGLAAARETGQFEKGLMDFTENFVTNLATSGYSKKNEYVADEEGLLLMMNAGLPIDQAIPAFQALAENEAYGAGDPRKMWSSHPRLEDRIDNLEKEVKRAKRKKDYVEPPVPDPLDYYRHIAPALLMNARMDIGERQFQRARDALQKYLQVHPDDPEALFLLGESHRQENPRGPEFTDSVAAYRAAILQDSGYADAYKELGMAYRIQQNNEAAKQAFEQYLAFAADAPDAGIVRAYLEGLQ